MSLKLNLGKNDVWDTRYNTPSKTEEVAVTQDELIAYVEEHGVVSPELLNKPKKKGEPVGHSPLRVGAIRIVQRRGTRTRSVRRNSSRPLFRKQPRDNKAVDSTRYFG